MKILSLLCATTALVMPGLAFAQSSGSVEVEEEIVVTGTRTRNGVEGILVPDAAKAKAVLTQEAIARSTPGQSILNAINIIPGVNFTNSDAYGSSGGNIRIRGFDGNRISLTFDGLPLNDTGNYAIFSNQQLDPELIEQVNVNLGTTDVDSPTASAAGGTVNYRTRIPGDEFGALGTASYGEDDYNRVFGMIDTGVLTGFGTKAFVAASTARNDKFKGFGEIYKQQYNARLYQPLGDNGDFISVSGHYNQNRNNFYRNPSVSDLRTVLGSPYPIPPVTAGGVSPAFPTSANPIFIDNDFDVTADDRILAFENNRFCVLDAPTANVIDNDNAGSSADPRATAGCTNFIGLRINPSNTGNIRGQSRFSLADNLILTVDPSFQYVLANGGGTTVLSETSLMLRGSRSATLAGIDLNGDGDIRDSVRLFTPNNTNTRRYGVIASLIWDPAPEHRFRVSYTYDRGRHRQTGEFGFLDAAGNPQSPFGGRNGPPVLDGDGNPLQQRDRLSIALLNQVSGQYIGKFFDNKLRLEVGVRAPFFQRDLNQFCFTQTGGSGFATCTGQPGGPGTIVPPTATVIPSGQFFAPFETTYKFDKLLPSVGFTYAAFDGASIFGSYAKGFSAPRTDNLYRAPLVTVQPETTDAFDLGLRYTTGRVQAQGTAWYISYKNRILTTFDPELGISLDRNVGAVDSYGFDGSIAYKPVDQLTLYAFGSYINAEFQEDVRLGNTSAPGPGRTVPAGTPIFAPTKGKMVAETPEWQYGGRVQLELGDFEIGATAKYVDDRFATDVNDVVVEGYGLVDLDIRYNLASLGLEKAFFQLNVSNLFDQFYFGNISTQVNAGNICPAGASCANNAANPSFAVGPPRTFVGTFRIGF